MSAQARHFLRIWFGVLARMDRPSANPRIDRELFEDEHRVRILAADLIGFGVSPENEPSECSARGTRARSESGCFSVHPLPNFCQAGVVAPPDSLMDEKCGSKSYGVAA